MSEHNQENSQTQPIIPDHVDVLANLASIEDRLQSEDLAIAIEKAEELALSEEAKLELQRARQVVAGLSLESKEGLINYFAVKRIKQEAAKKNPFLSKAGIFSAGLISITAGVFAGTEKLNMAEALVLSLGGSSAVVLADRKRISTKATKFYINEVDSLATKKILEQARMPKNPD